MNVNTFFLQHVCSNILSSINDSRQGKMLFMHTHIFCNKSSSEDCYCSQGGKIHLQRSLASNDKVIITHLYIPLDSCYYLKSSFKTVKKKIKTHNLSFVVLVSWHRMHLDIWYHSIKCSENSIFKYMACLWLLQC